MAFQASKKRNPGRQAWLVEFRHPLKQDTNQKPGKKVRRGLGTSLDEDADQLIAQLNDLLADESLWSIGAKAEASRRFDNRVIEIFYSEIERRPDSPKELRDNLLPLPGSSVGYARVLMLGIPGAGKTTLLRQLIGTDPRLERFPSTSVNRTTTYPTEVVTGVESFDAVATFMSEHEARFEIEECVASAVVEAVTGNEDNVARTFLERSDMRFRLKYILGSYKADDEYDDYDETPESDLDSEWALSAEEKESLSVRVASYVTSIIRLAKHLRVATEAQQGPLEDMSFEDRNAALDLIEEEAQASDDFIEIVSSVLDDVRSRFEVLNIADLQRTSTGWPKAWKISMRASDREAFIQSLRPITGIAKVSWGRLLTPLVNGLRVFGPFKPTWAVGPEKLILIDTEGLGHKAGSNAEMPEQLIPELGAADSIVLVDSAKSGVTLAAGKALEGIVNAGHTRKLTVVFTHMDALVSENLTGNAKFDHAFLGIRNVIENQVAKNVSQEAARYLLERLKTSTFYLGKIQQADPKPAIKALESLLAHLAAAKSPDFVATGFPEYSPDNLVLAIQQAIMAFRQDWRGNLGLVPNATAKPKPWQTLKAMSRRYADNFDDGFWLRPTNDLTNHMLSAISRFLENPVKWDGSLSPEDKREVIDHVKALVSQQLPEFSSQRLRVTPHLDWVQAYGLKGFGSTVERKLKIEGIYEKNLPIPSASGNPDVSKLLDQIKELVFGAIKGAQGSSAA